MQTKADLWTVCISDWTRVLLMLPALWDMNILEIYHNIRKKLRSFGYEAGYLKAADEEDSEVIRFYDPDGHIIEVRRSSTCA